MRKFIVTTLALIVSLTLPTLSTASEAKSAFQSLSECERKFVQDFLKVEGYYKSSVDGVQEQRRLLLNMPMGVLLQILLKAWEGVCLPVPICLMPTF